MTHTKFSWAWNNEIDRADPLMSRQRAAKLIKSWRRDPRIKVIAARAGRIHTYTANTYGNLKAMMVIERV